MQASQTHTRDVQTDAPRPVSERMHTDSVTEAAAPTQPPQAAEEPPRYQRNLAIDSSDDDEPSLTSRHVRFANIRRRHVARSERLDLNQPWEEVILNLNGRNWGVFSLSDLAIILHDHYINPVRNDVTTLRDRVGTVNTLVQQMRTDVQGMVTQLGTTVHTTAHTSQTVDNIRQQTVQHFQELINQTVQQQQTLTNETARITRRFEWQETRIRLIAEAQARMSRRISDIEDHLELGDDTVEPVEPEDFSSNGSEHGMDGVFVED